jgi:two-component system LytT family response regulator
MRVLIVDDEPLARTALEQILKARPDLDCFDSASDAVEAQDLLTRGNFDVMLLDISMPELSGFDLLDRLQKINRPLPAIVFVTAYSEHALAAFERHAVDYILKPFSAERVNQGLEVASRRSAGDRAAMLIALTPDLRLLSQRRPLKVAIKTDGRILFIDPHDLVVVQAEGNYVLLQREAGSYLLRESISNIAEKLKPYGFVRIHRSLLVNAASVQEIRPCVTGEYSLRVKGGKEYTVTRTYKKNLKSLAHFWIGAGTFLAD